MTDYWWGNITHVDCVLETDDVAIMMSSSKKFLHVFTMQFLIKRIYRICSHLEN